MTTIKINFMHLPRNISDFQSSPGNQTQTLLPVHHSGYLSEEKNKYTNIGLFKSLSNLFYVFVMEFLQTCTTYFPRKEFVQFP